MTLEEVQRHVEQAGFFTFVRTHRASDGGDLERDLVCASRRMPNGQGLTGCSFAVKERAGCWYVVTWGPRAYRVAPSLVPDVCLAFLRYTGGTPADVPEELKSAYRLTETEEA